MGYRFVIEKDIGFRPVSDMVVPWPCNSAPERTIELFGDDVLTKSEDGTWMKQTGLGCLGIVLRDDQVKPLEKDVYLQI